MRHQVTETFLAVDRRLWLAALGLASANAVVVAFAEFATVGRWLAASGAVLIVLVLTCRRAADRAPLWLFALVAASIQLPWLFTYPLTSDDVFRYVWDGRVQWEGIDPYRYAPLDPVLEYLRDPYLFPPGERPRINRPGVPTLYPPVAQVWFAFWSLVTPTGWHTLGVRVGAALAAVAATTGLARFLGRRRGWALLFGACPAVGLEAANGGHLDALAALLMVCVGFAAVRRRHWLAGLFLGLAAGVKLVPLLLAPVFLRRGRWRTTVGALLVLVAGYVPHVLAVGALVAGFLPGYLEEEGYGGARRFALLSWLPEPARAPVALSLAGALALLAIARSGREPVLLTCCWLYGCALLIATPVYPWYALGYVVVVLMAGRLEWLALWPACYVAFVYDHSLTGQAIGYGLAALVVVAAIAWRRLRRYAATGSGPVEPRSTRLVAS